QINGEHVLMPIRGIDALDEAVNHRRVRQHDQVRFAASGSQFIAELLMLRKRHSRRSGEHLFCLEIRGTCDRTRRCLVEFELQVGGQAEKRHDTWRELRKLKLQCFYTSITRTQLECGLSPSA